MAVHGRYTGNDLFTNHRAFDRYSFSLLGFFIPLFYGLLGRNREKETALYKAAGWVILLSPVMIAVGISFSRLFDTFSVTLYVIALYLYGILLYENKVSIDCGKSTNCVF
ncbi:hypothetical protein BsIDN1_36520 [Bacillus safensis]|uniref:Uncharacterized protein n=1 Tax=Bacillus safensis TaxID=561879 RepID=A0A5S9MD28_BACIA|nr:hypothetical protein BsIDN1_36520 [Bacillus safensis]